MKYLFLFCILTALFPKTTVASEVGMKPILEGKASHYCLVSLDDENKPGYYNKNVFSGSLNANENNLDQIIITPDGKYQPNLDGINYSEIKNTVLIQAQESKVNLNDKENKRLAISVSRFLDAKSLKDGQSALTRPVIATGDFDGMVQLIDGPNHISITCQNKAKFTKNIK